MNMSNVVQRWKYVKKMYLRLKRSVQVKGVFTFVDNEMTIE